jgi:DeoR/GlpR family transcriptional regulator of sugar metabolism
VSRDNTVRLIVLGGTFRPEYRAFLGTVCELALAELHADILFVSSSAVLGTDVFHQDEPVVKAKRAMMEASQRRVLMLDHSKFGRGALQRVASINEFTDVIVDDGTDAEVIDGIRDTGVHLIVASPADVSGQ